MRRAALNGRAPASLTRTRRPPRRSGERNSEQRAQLSYHLCCYLNSFSCYACTRPRTRSAPRPLTKGPALKSGSLRTVACHLYIKSSNYIATPSNGWQRGQWGRLAMTYRCGWCTGQDGVRGAVGAMERQVSRVARYYLVWSPCITPHTPLRPPPRGAALCRPERGEAGWKGEEIVAGVQRAGGAGRRTTSWWLWGGC